MKFRVLDDIYTLHLLNNQVVASLFVLRIAAFREKCYIYVYICK